MTTTEPSTSSSSGQAPCSAWPPLACLQRRKETLCQTDLPVRSAPGVWLLVGMGVVLVGMCVAVAGYASASSAPKPLQGGRGTSHAERMKLAGPVVMGVGLFIFICSATLLYENRDSALLTLRPAGPGDGAPVLGDEEEGLSPRRPCCSCRDRRHRPHRRCSGEPDQGSWASSLSLAPSLCRDPSDEDHDDVDPGSPSPGRGLGVVAVSLAPGGRGGGQTESPDPPPKPFPPWTPATPVRSTLIYEPSWPLPSPRQSRGPSHWDVGPRGPLPSLLSPAMISSGQTMRRRRASDEETRGGALSDRVSEDCTDTPALHTDSAPVSADGHYPGERGLDF